MEKLEVLEQEVSIITSEIVEHQEEAMRLEIIIDVLQQEIELHKPIFQNNDELPF